MQGYKRASHSVIHLVALFLVYSVLVILASLQSAPQMPSAFASSVLSMSPTSLQKVYLPFLRREPFSIAIVKSTGIDVTSTLGSGSYVLVDGSNVSDPSWSPDGQQLVFTRRDNTISWIERVTGDGSGRIPLFQCRATCVDLAWSPNGQQIAFAMTDPSNSEPNFDLYTIQADGSNLRRLTHRLETDWEPTWSPSGAEIMFEARSTDGETSIWKIHADGSKLTQILSPEMNAFHPAWSPDGAKVAFLSGDSEQAIYLMTPTGTNIRRIPLAEGDTPLEVRWAPDGKQLSYMRLFGRGGEIIIIDGDGANRRSIGGGLSHAWRPRP